MTRSSVEVTFREGRGFTRDMGNVISASGKKLSVRFALGYDRSRAEQSVLLIEQIWNDLVKECIAGGFEAKETIWYGWQLWGAKQIAKGKRNIVFDVPPQINTIPDPVHRAYSYALTFAHIKSMFHMVTVTPADPELLEAGKQVAAGKVEDMRVVAEYQASVAQVRSPTRPHNGQMLHAAIESFSEWLAGRHIKGAETQSKRALQLKHSVVDRPLDEVGRSALEEITNYWASRPFARTVKGVTERPISVATVGNMLSDARRFVNWLDESDTWEWDKPKGAERILRVDAKSIKTPKEISEKAEGVLVWTIEELGILYGLARPYERLLMLLSLNTGAAGAEIQSLLKSEIDDSSDPPQIKRLRHKNHVLGQWPLWPETMQALEAHWAEHGGNHEAAVLSTRGEPSTGKSIGSQWSRFMKRVVKVRPELQVKHKQFGFKYMRKTAAQLVRNVSDGEIAGVFLMHGRAVKSDDLADIYSNRPFDKVAEATMQVHEQLQHFLEA